MNKNNNQQWKTVWHEFLEIIDSIMMSRYHMNWTNTSKRTWRILASSVFSDFMVIFPFTTFCHWVKWDLKIICWSAKINLEKKVLKINVCSHWNPLKKPDRTLDDFWRNQQFRNFFHSPFFCSASPVHSWPTLTRGLEKQVLSDGYRAPCNGVEDMKTAPWSESGGDGRHSVTVRAAEWRGSQGIKSTQVRKVLIVWVPLRSLVLWSRLSKCLWQVCFALLSGGFP